MIDLNLKLDISPRSACRRKAKEVEKVLMVRKEGTYTNRGEVALLHG